MLNQAIIDAIEDNDFADEALTAALFNKLSPVRATGLLEKAGNVVKSKTDYDTAVKEAAKVEAKAEIDTAIKGEGARFFGDIDTLLGKIAKQSKPAGMKTSEWYELIKDKISVPEEGDPVKAGQIAALEKKIEELSKKQDAPTIDIAKETNKLFKSSVKGLDIKIADTAKTDAEKETSKKATIGKIDAVFKAQYEYGGETTDGEPYFIKKGDDKKTAIVHSNGDPLTAGEIVTREYPEFLTVKGHKQSGGGTGPNNEQSAGNDLASIYAKATKEQGGSGSPAWRKRVDELKKEAGIK